MKRASAFIIAIICCLIISFTAFADDIYIIEDGEDEFIPAETTTVGQAETTTASSDGGLNIDMGSISDYLGSITDSFGDSIDSIISGFDGFDFNFGNSPETTTSSQLSGIQAGDYTQANQSGSMTTYPNSSNNIQTGQQEEFTTAVVVEEELPSVLIVGGTSDYDSWGLSGSTLTMIVFVAAIALLILVVVIVLIVMTRKTEFNSVVKQKSTLPSVERPSTLAQFIEDEIPSDGKDYSDIAYWNK